PEPGPDRRRGSGSRRIHRREADGRCCRHGRGGKRRRFSEGIRRKRMSATLYLLSAAADSATAIAGAAAPVADAPQDAAAQTQDAEPALLGLDTTGWAALSTLIFVGVLLYLKVPAAITKALDARIDGIKTQLDQAAKLRAEAEALKAEYEAKLAEAERNASEIFAAAKVEAENMLAAARQD